MQPKKQQEKRVIASLGGIFVILALVGLVTIATLLISFTGQLLDNKRQKTMFEELLTPVVMFDPGPFNSAADIEMNRLLLYSMWGCLSDPHVTTYARSDTNQLLVPAPDLEAAVYKLFGSGITLEHGSFTDYQNTYFYDKEHNTYEVQTYGFLYVNRPEVLQIDKVGDSYKLLIHYIPPDNAWGNIYAGADAAVLSTKQMVYVMEQVDGNWILVRVEDPPREGALPTGEGTPVTTAPKSESSASSTSSSSAESSPGSESSTSSVESTSSLPESSSSSSVSSEESRSSTSSPASASSQSSGSSVPSSVSSLPPASSTVSSVTPYVPPASSVTPVTPPPAPYSWIDPVSVPASVPPESSVLDPPPETSEPESVSSADPESSWAPSRGQGNADGNPLPPSWADLP